LQSLRKLSHLSSITHFHLSPQPLVKSCEVQDPSPIEMGIDRRKEGPERRTSYLFPSLLLPPSHLPLFLSSPTSQDDDLFRSQDHLALTAHRSTRHTFALHLQRPPFAGKSIPQAPLPSFTLPLDQESSSSTYHTDGGTTLQSAASTGRIRNKGGSGQIRH